MYLNQHVAGVVIHRVLESHSIRKSVSKSEVGGWYNNVVDHKQTVQNGRAKSCPHRIYAYIKIGKSKFNR